MEDAKAQFSGRNFERAIELCTRVLSESPESSEGLACRVIRASSYELIDSSDRALALTGAIHDYSILADDPGWVGAVGHAGLARTLYLQNAESNCGKIKMHADVAIERSGHVPSMVIAGAVIRDFFLDEKLARKYFLKAARARDYWGFKYLSVSILESCGWLALVVVVPIFYLMAPFFRMREQPFDD